MSVGPGTAATQCSESSGRQILLSSLFISMRFSGSHEAAVARTAWKSVEQTQRELQMKIWDLVKHCPLSALEAWTCPNPGKTPKAGSYVYLLLQQLKPFLPKKCRCLLTGDPCAAALSQAKVHGDPVTATMKIWRLLTR